MPGHYPTPPPPPKPKPPKPKPPKPKNPFDEQNTNNAAGQSTNRRPTHYADGLDTGP